MYIGYAATTLYAEAETRLFVANNSESSDYESSDYLYMEEVRVFLKNNNNNSKVYFKLEESASVIEMTTNKSEAAFFTLKTTPDLHRLGQFQLVYATSNVSQTRTPANPMQDEIIIKLDSEGPRTQYGPYKLLSYTEQCRNIVHFKIRGKSTTLPELQ